MDPDVYRMLGILARPLTNQTEYSQRLLQSGDEYLRAAGLAALLDLAAVPMARWRDVLGECRHGFVATRAFKFFMSNFEYELAEQVASTFGHVETPASLVEEMRARLTRDSARLLEIHAREFLRVGGVEHLIAAAEHAEASAGWRAAAIWLARAMLLQPTDAGGAYPLLRLLEIANQFDWIEEILETLSAGNAFPEARALFTAVVRLQRKDANAALQAVSKLRPSEIRTTAPLKERLFQLRAQASEALGQYRDAMKWYQEMNRQGVVAGLDKRAYLTVIERLAHVDYPALPDDQHTNHFMMLGFPRSGTTLLENALAAHPAIETFEEIPSLTRTVVHVERILESGAADEEQRRASFEQARQIYYDEIERRKSKPGARIFLDKLPIRTAWIGTLEKLFPQKRYIFSIRHPYDVVLSCFKQSFTPNAAMENFRTLEDACEFYDRVMSIWFDVFPAENDRIHYVRYEKLVEDFEREIGRTLAFLGVDWNDEVRHFAELSERRQAATPSYAKVRGGLGVGIQSSWMKYRFVFDTRHGAKLHKWVERFGYERQ